MILYRNSIVSTSFHCVQRSGRIGVRAAFSSDRIGSGVFGMVYDNTAQQPQLTSLSKCFCFCRNP